MHCSTTVCFVLLTCTAFLFTCTQPPTDATDPTDAHAQDTTSDLPDYANISDIQAHIHREPPPSAPPPDQQPVEVTGDWERYEEPATGRYYFYNRVTMETSWIQPAGAAQKGDVGVGRVI